MPKRPLTSAVILLFAAAVLCLTFIYGPIRRQFAPRNAVVSALSIADVSSLYATTGVRGRVLLFFSRQLLLPEGISVYPENGYIQLALNHGIIRKIVQIVPDGTWSEIGRWNLLSMLGYWRTQDGIVGAWENGRVEYTTLSHFGLVDERALVIVDAASWSHGELTQISSLIRTGRIDSDLVAVLRGAPADVELFR